MHIAVLVLMGMVTQTKEGVLFIYEDPGAKHVFVAGSFNGWSKTPMMEEDGVWKTVIEIPPGRYEYKFVVDNKWIPDPDNPVKSGPFDNSVFILREDGRVMIPGEGRVFFSGYMNFLSVRDTLFYGNAWLTMMVSLERLSGEFQIHGNTRGEFGIYRMKISSGPFFIFYNYPIYSTHDPFLVFGKEDELGKPFGEGWEGGGAEHGRYSLMLAGGIDTEEVVFGFEVKNLLSGRFEKERKEITLYWNGWGMRGGMRKDAEFIEGTGRFSVFSLRTGYMKDTLFYLFSLAPSLGIEKKHLSFSYTLHLFWSSPSLSSSFLYSFPHFDKFLHFEEPLIGKRTIHEAGFSIKFPWFSFNLRGAWNPEFSSYVVEGIYRLNWRFAGIEGRTVFYPDTVIYQPFLYLRFSPVSHASVLIGYGFDPRDELGEIRYWKVLDEQGWERSPYLMENAPSFEWGERRWEIRADFYF